MQHSKIILGTVIFFSLFQQLCLSAADLDSAETQDETYRGLTKIRTRQPDDTLVVIELYRSSHALVIGVSRYNNGWPEMPGVLEDVLAVREKLEENGFLVTMVLDPDSLKLRQSFENCSSALRPFFLLSSYCRAAMKKEKDISVTAKSTELQKAASGEESTTSGMPEHTACISSITSPTGSWG